MLLQEKYAIGTAAAMITVSVRRPIFKRFAAQQAARGRGKTKYNR